MISVTLSHALKNITTDQHIWIAYSGGLDSQVLLHVLVNLKLPNQLKALHVHHNLSPNADLWAEFCSNTCRQYHIECDVEYVDASPRKNESPEAAARRVRYDAFQKNLSFSDVLLTAHHQNDQAETLLLQLLRGAGVKGASAMPKEILLQQKNINLVRPLLTISRLELQNYAKKHQLDWVEDESNMNVKFDRNYLRNNVLPGIECRWPNAIETFARAAGQFSEAQFILDDVAETDLENLCDHQKKCLSLQPLMKLSKARQKNVLRYWIRQQGWQPPSRNQLNDFLLQLTAREDKHPKLKHKEWVLQRYHQHVYLYLDLVDLPQAPIDWDGRTQLQLPADLGIISPAIVQSNWPAPLTIRFRAGGERIRLSGREHHHSLKKLWQQWGVPPWLRARTPLIYGGDQLVAVVGYTSYTIKVNPKGVSYGD